MKKFYKIEMCTHCSNALFIWKKGKQGIIYKYPGYTCPHYLKNKLQLTTEEKIMRGQQKGKHNLSGFWSRRINNKHRLVYKIKNNTIIITQLKYHY